MKQIIILFLMTIYVFSFGQQEARKIHAKQPTIMVVPSGIYCERHGYTKKFDNQGTIETVDDYNQLFRKDENMRQVLSKINEMIKDRGYSKIVDLEQMLNKLNKDNAYMNVMRSKTSNSEIRRTPLDILKEEAKADIIINVDFDIKQMGARKYIHYDMKGIDAYISSFIAGASGDGDPSFSSTSGKLIEEAVLSHIDNFLDQLQSYFDELFEKGREVRIVVRVFDSGDVDLEEEYTYEGEESELTDIIEFWVEDNAVEGRMDVVNSSEDMMDMKVRIPLYYQKKNGKQSALTAKKFAKKIVKSLKEPPFHLTMKIDNKGLGEAWIFIGEK